MKHEFTDDQIIDAKHAAARHMSRDWISRFNVKDIRACLDALPEPQDEWEQCTIDQIRKGDRFKVEGRGWHYESTAIHIDVDIVCVNPRTGSFITRDEVDQINEITLYRIPAPVQHPDPEEHEFIIIYGGEVLRYDGHRYYINRVGKPTSLEMIMANWTPVDVVPKVAADDDPVRPEDVGF